MNANDAWKQFIESGSVPDYLQYVQAQRAAEDAGTEEHHEAQDQGIDHPTAEYR